MKLREFNFNSLKRRGKLVGLSVRMGDGPWYEKGGIGETLRALPLNFADATIKETRWFFNVFVIELEENK